MKKVIVISGGSDGLGKVVASQLSSQNTVVILSDNKEKLEAVAQELNCDFEVCDVTDYEQVKSAVEAVIKKHQQIDCLINNAGVWIEGELDDNDPQRIAKVIGVNTMGTIFLTKAVTPHMKKQSEGRILNIISQAGFYGKAERSVYTASKFAITGFTKSIQPELAKYGVGVTGIYPGKMKTQMFEKMGIEKKMDDALDPEEVAKTIEFILSCNNTTVFPEVGIKYIHN